MEILKKEAGNEKRNRKISDILEVRKEMDQW